MNAPPPFQELEANHYGALLVDPPWRFQIWSPKGADRAADNHYRTQTTGDIASLPVGELASDDSILFLWTCWPHLKDGLAVIDAWGFSYKSCAFDWLKANNTQADFFQEELPVQIGLGYWTRSNTEPCLLATRGRPKRLNADVRQAIIAPRREHSRKPDGIHERIERLVAGPYLELFARQTRAGWSCWGNEVGKFDRQIEAVSP